MEAPAAVEYNSDSEWRRCPAQPATVLTGSASPTPSLVSNFCNVCGSTVPNSLRDVPYVWVPVGLIDERLEMECAGDFCTDDAMPWDETRSPSCHAGPVESLASLLKYLKLNS